MRHLSPFVFPILAAALSGCASGPTARVIHTESDRLASISAANNEPDARMAAVDAALKHCEERKSEAIFADKDLGGTRQHGPRLDLSKLPVVGKVFSDNGKSQVILDFRCGQV